MCFSPTLSSIDIYIYVCICSLSSFPLIYHTNSSPLIIIIIIVTSYLYNILFLKLIVYIYIYTLQVWISLKTMQCFFPLVISRTELLFQISRSIPSNSCMLIPRILLYMYVQWICNRWFSSRWERILWSCKKKSRLELEAPKMLWWIYFRVYVPWSILYIEKYVCIYARDSSVCVFDLHATVVRWDIGTKLISAKQIRLSIF